MAGPPDGPPLILGPSLGTSLAVWEPQLAALARHHRVLRFDLPGHGRSAASPLPPNGAARLDDLAATVLRLADARGWERFAYAGISLGGAIGLHLAARHPDRVSRLAVLSSSAHFGPPEPWHERAATVTARGTGALVPGRTGVWFAPEVADTPLGAALLSDLRCADDGAYAACCAALAACDLRADLPAITAPTLVLTGRDDPVTPPAHAREIADAVPGADLVEIARAAHLVNVERPGPVGAALLGHFAEPDTPDTPAAPAAPAARGGDPGTDAARRAVGTAIRRAVLGDAHVDRARARTTAFTEDFQDFLTRYAWGEIWNRPGLSRRARSCVTLTALVAGGHHDELALHTRAALRNGLTPEEIAEVLLQTAVYCGVPAANAAFTIAGRALREADGEEPSP
ncbi:4-carboxymuconolactone decarboxylase [Streptomyces sp. PT12]|uniref:bifunctional 3-oxoadipate enol-lactonase/4-carboxymuconolactone decarboxylase PcaDC n=1 Tax=Streptomyces sp. PT12 TaxID=1510197 RepID=UPI00215C7073|nr:4-carboxymuconolactone decarboxylase [Streptomyces sp. PT12]